MAGCPLGLGQVQSAVWGVITHVCVGTSTEGLWDGAQHFPTVVTLPEVNTEEGSVFYGFLCLIYLQQAGIYIQ